MADRTVSVRLRMQVHDYTSGAAQAALATNRLADQLARLEREASGVGKGLDAAARKVTASAKKFDAAAAMYEGSANRFASSSKLWEQHAAQAGEAADKLGAASKTVQQSAGRHDRASKRYEAAADRWAVSSAKFAAAARTHNTAAGLLGTVSFGGGGGGKAAREVDQAGKSLSELGKRAGTVLAVTASAAAAAGGAIQYIAPAAVAAGAAAGTLPGILGGAAAAMGTVKVASIGLSDALGDMFEVDDPFTRLSPSAKALVQQVGVLKPQLLDLQQSLQDTAYAPAAGNLDRLAKVTLPVVGRQAQVLAQDWAEAMTAMTNAATDPQVLGAFTTVTATTDRFLDQANRRLQPLAVSLAQLAQSADPLVQAIGDRLIGAVDGLIAGIQRARASGNLDEFFRSGAESADALLSIAGNILSITGQVVSQVNQQNASIVEAANAFEAYMASGRGAADVTGAVETLTAAYEGMAEVLGPLASIARDALADPGTRDGLAAMFDVLAVGSQTLRTVFDMFQVLPDEVQGFLLAAIGVGLAMKKINTVATAMGLAVQGAATKVSALGSVGERAGKGMNRFAVGAGKAVAALAALQIAGTVLASFQDSLNPQVDALSLGLARFAQNGEVAGEAARVFGSDMQDLGVGFKYLADGDNGRRQTVKFMQQVLESAPLIGPALQGTNTSLAKTQERITAMDQALTGLVQNGQADAAAEAFKRFADAQAVNGVSLDEVKAKFPQYIAALEQADAAAQTGVGSAAALTRQTKLLSGGLEGAVTAGRSFLDIFNEINGATLNSADARRAAEESIDNLSDALDKNGKALNKQGTDFNFANEKGRENQKLTSDLTRAAAEAAQRKFEETGSVEEAAGVYDHYIGQLRKTLQGAKFTDEQIAILIERYGSMPDLVSTTVTAPGAEDAGKKVGTLGTRVKQLPNGKVVVVGAKTDDAMRDVLAVKSVLNSLRNRSFTITGQVRWVTSGSVQGLKVPGGTLLKRWGGIDRPVAMAAGGMMQAGIYPASNPPLVKFAEPETGGEAYIPRKGRRERNLSILAEAASWSNARVVPMASGGIIAGGSMIAAASGLVAYGTSASATSTDRGSALESVEAYIQARDAIARLNDSLKENGRSFDLSTKKGRANYSATIDSVKAAEAAAQAKFRETGSVEKANKEYDAHIAKLRATLKQQKVSASTIDSLMKKLATRPTYDQQPVGSEKNIAATQAAISAEGSLASITDLFSLNKPIFDVKDEVGRENLTALFRFLKDAQDAAQAVLEQTGDKKKATGVYDSYVAQLRKILSGSGMAKSQIDSLLKQYGKIVLTPNAIGGVYMGSPSGLLSLSEGGLFDSAKTLYGFAERGTGGELFLPRLGSRRRGEDLLSIGAGWYGGRYVRGGQGQGVSTQVTNNLTVNSQAGPPSLSELSALQRQMDARARVGRKG